MSDPTDEPPVPEFFPEEGAPDDLVPEMDPELIADAVLPEPGQGAGPERPLRPVSALKVPPHSVEAERSVLGGLMLSGEAWFNVADKVTADEFYRTNHQLIFEAMFALAEQNQPLDAVTLAEHLENKGLLEKAGGYGYLGELTEATPGATNVAAYANIVRERATLRRLIAARRHRARDME
ncbi:MAG: DnaB-like helicase N-terminal domain-containing protein, partial [Pseudomonadota bacterium]